MESCYDTSQSIYGHDGDKRNIIYWNIEGQDGDKRRTKLILEKLKTITIPLVGTVTYKIIDKI